jgi:hypothetical protein
MTPHDYKTMTEAMDGLRRRALLTQTKDCLGMDDAAA